MTSNIVLIETIIVIVNLYMLDCETKRPKKLAAPGGVNGEYLNVYKFNTSLANFVFIKTDFT